MTTSIIWCPCVFLVETISDIITWTSVLNGNISQTFIWRLNMLHRSPLQGFMQKLDIQRPLQLKGFGKSAPNPKLWNTISTYNLILGGMLTSCTVIFKVGAPKHPIGNEALLANANSIWLITYYTKKSTVAERTACWLQIPWNNYHFPYPVPAFGPKKKLPHRQPREQDLNCQKYISQAWVLNMWMFWLR